MSAHAFLQKVQQGLPFRLFLLQKLPAAFWAGVKLQKASPESCTVSVPYRWATQNPFRSTYFACLAMGAEMSTGILAMAHLYGRRPAISMLVVHLESNFHKKATGITYFTCADGAKIEQAVAQAVQTGQGQTVKVLATGNNSSGEVVAEFWFTWSFKQKANKERK